MKFSKIKVGISLIVIGLVVTGFFYSYSEILDTLCGASVGIGIGFFVQGLLERRKKIQKTK